MKQLLNNYDFEIVKLDRLSRAVANGRGRARILVFNLSDIEQLTMVEIPGGDFLMGASSEELEARERVKRRPISSEYLRSFLPGFPSRSCSGIR